MPTFRSPSCTAALVGVLTFAAAPRAQGVVIDDSSLVQHFATWWEFNADSYLPQPRFAPAAVAAARAAAVPALLEALREASNQDLVSCCMVALARLVPPDADLDLTGLLRARLRSQHQQEREDAALALGISGRKDALDLLIAMACDQPAGRAARGAEALDLRTRTFAVHGLGCCADAADDAELQVRVGGVALLLLGEPVQPVDLRIAVVSTLSLLRLDVGAAPQRALLLGAVRRLADIGGKRTDADEARVAAHVPTAIARLQRGTRGSAPEVASLFAAQREAWRQDAALRLKAGSTEDVLLESEILALGDALDGTGSDGAADAAEEAAAVALFRSATAASDPVVQHFAVLALGRVGGVAARNHLLALAETSRGHYGRNWLLLALGLLEHHRRTAQGADWRPDADVGAAIERQGRGGPDCASPIAMGLARVQGATDLLVARLDARSGLGHVCEGLVLAEGRSAGAALRTLLERDRLDIDTFCAAARALSVLGDEQLGPVLERQIDRAVAQQGLSRISGVLTGAEHHLGAASQLIAILRRKDLRELARAFAATSLGRMLDRQARHSFTRLGIGFNYRAAVPTLSDRHNGLLDRR